MSIIGLEEVWVRNYNSHYVNTCNFPVYFARIRSVQLLILVLIPPELTIGVSGFPVAWKISRPSTSRRWLADAKKVRPTPKVN